MLTLIKDLLIAIFLVGITLVWVASTHAAALY
jgi:hypothetical protein